MRKMTIRRLAITVLAVSALSSVAVTAKNRQDLFRQIEGPDKKTIAYVFGDLKRYIPDSIIQTWFSTDENGNRYVDRDRIKEYVEGLAREYDTAWSDRVFVSDDGAEYTIPASTNTYGFMIDIDNETDMLIYDITENPEKAISREPVYAQRGTSRNGKDDLCGTYVEVDIANQEVTCYRDGVLIDKTSCVSGNESAGTPSDRGVFCIYDKQQNTVLRGQNPCGTWYESPVAYWMPYNGGEGLHDASWRWEFGGNIYMWNGSHGCINLRLEDAKAIYENVDVGTPVIVHD